MNAYDDAYLENFRGMVEEDRIVEGSSGRDRVVEGMIVEDNPGEDTLVGDNSGEDRLEAGADTHFQEGG
jgi:hypothetical protein